MVRRFQTAPVLLDLANGVYVAMNGRFFHWNNVRKDRRTGEFIETDG